MKPSQKITVGFLTLLSVTSLLAACQQKDNPTTTETKTIQKVEKSSKPVESNQNKVNNQENKAETSNTTENVATTENTSQDTDALIPETLIGTWAGSSLQATNVAITITADGAVSTTATFFDNEEPISYNAQIIQVNDLGNGYYALSTDGDYSALLPGITGLGGMGFKVANGFKVDTNTITPVQWTAAPEQEFDYTTPQDFNVILTKQ